MKNKYIKKNKKIIKKKVLNTFKEGIIYIYASFNNTIITITNYIGKTIAWSSAGKMGFKGAKKSTPYAAQKASESLCKIILESGIKILKIKVKGPGPGRDSAIRALNDLGIRISQIQDITPIPHNGCKAPKKRRI